MTVKPHSREMDLHQFPLNAYFTVDTVDLQVLLSNLFEYQLVIHAITIEVELDMDVQV